MQEIPIFSLGALPAFLRVNTDDNYWSERINYELSAMLYSASQAGMAIQRPEVSDFEDYSTDLTGFVAAFKTWVAAAFDRSNTRGLSPDERSRLLVQDFTDLVPDIITTGGTVATAALTGGSSLLIPMLVNAGLGLLTHIIAGQANNLISGESENIADIAEAIRESFLRSRNSSESLSLLVSETGSGVNLVRVPISEVLFKGLLSDSGTVLVSLLQQIVSGFAVRVYREDGSNWLEFGFPPDVGVPGE